MTMSKSDLRRQLSDIEPDEGTYEGIGPEEVGLLRELLDHEEAWLAARAVHALSRIDAGDARDAVRAATASPRMEVRVAVASAAETLHPELSDEVLSTLLEDANIGVRKIAVKSVSGRNGEAVKLRIRDMVTEERDPRLREIAEEQAKAIFPR